MSQLDEMIWQTVAAIPKGKVMTYGQIAQQCGYPGYARYVGKTLKDLPVQSEIPWHRVINAKGNIAFPPESEAYQQQKALLEAEAVQFHGARINLSIYRWNS